MDWRLLLAELWSTLGSNVAGARPEPKIIAKHGGYESSEQRIARGKKPNAHDQQKLAS